MQNRPTEQDGQPQSGRPGTAAETGVNILLVDDDPKNLAVLEAVLDVPGYRLVSALSGEQALLALIEDEFAVIVADVRMPEMNGFELALLIKERRKTAEVPIIFLSAQDEDELVLEGYGSGAVDYLLKPVNAPVLRSKVAIFAELHRSRRALLAANRQLEAEVAERRRAEAALQAATAEARQASHAKSTFLAAMSHEIRTPMYGVLGMLELLGLSRLDGEQRSTLSVIRASAQSLLRIVDDILDFSRIEANRIDLRTTVASLEKLVARVCQVHSSRASAKGLLLRTDVAADLHPAYVFDRQRVEQILNNLIGNALKFTERGVVEVAVRVTERKPGADRLCLQVRDTGIGIDAQSQRRLFQPYAQADPDTASRFGGTGLGLVISRRLAELMGGTLTLHSVPGQGTTLTLECTFPLATDAQHAAAASEEAAQRALEALTKRSRPAPSVADAQAEGTLVLVVDDHPTNRMVLQQQLLALGYAAETAVDGREGYDAWKSGRFALVIADCNMPNMSGHELARAVRRDEQASRARRTPIFACTANAMATEAALCLEAGMDEYLVKPAELSALARCLAQWLPLPRAPALVNHAMLRTIAGDDPAAIRRLLAQYLQTHQQDASALHAALARPDLVEVGRLAHRIRGACKTMGSLALESVVGLIEEQAVRGELDGLRQTMPAFDDELARLLSLLPQEGNTDAV
jgi:signal transduction histidine kinase/HPt (histidine-containing phosphotransfer) domain-containing protein